MKLFRYLFQPYNTQESEENDDEIIGSFYKINRGECECIRSQCHFLFEKEDSQIYLICSATDKEDIHIAVKNVSNFFPYIKDGFLFTYNTDKGFREYGIQLFKKEMAKRFYKELQQYILHGSEVVAEFPCALALYDYTDKGFIAVSAECDGYVMRRSSGDAYLIIKKADETILQESISPRMGLWCIPSCAQIVFWGRRNDRNELYLLEILDDEMGDVNIEFFDALYTVIRQTEKGNQNNKQEIINFIDQGADQKTSSYSEDDVMNKDMLRYEDIERDESEDEFFDSLDQNPAEVSWEEKEAKPSRSNIKDNHKFMSIGRNRTYVCRDTNNSQHKLHVYRYNRDSDHPIDTAATIDSNKLKYAGQTVNPRNGLLHDKESKLLLSDQQDVYLFDIESQKIVRSWDAGYKPVDQMLSTFKDAQCTTDPTFIAYNEYSLSLLDTRVDKDAVCSSISYVKNPLFSSAATDGEGRILLGSRLGDMRLYDGKANKERKYKKAKNQLSYIKDPIFSVDVTLDGSLILGTTEEYLVLYPVRMTDGRTGFDVSFGQHRPNPRYLYLSFNDREKYGLKSVKFTAARFHCDDKLILTSLAHLAIVWDVSSVLNGDYRYEIKEGSEDIRDVQSLYDASVVLAYDHNVGLFEATR